jgi:hypothetical protein
MIDAELTSERIMSCTAIILHDLLDQHTLGTSDWPHHFSLGYHSRCLCTSGGFKTLSNLFELRGTCTKSCRTISRQSRGNGAFPHLNYNQLTESSFDTKQSRGNWAFPNLNFKLVYLIFLTPSY